jgi:UDP-3-O-[3-hydroxymyristoyl] glucosamine N-acyltransferase
MEVALHELVAIIGGALAGDGSVAISGVSGIREAGPGTITFLANPRYNAFLETTRASAVIVPRGTVFPAKPVVESDNPYLTFVKAVEFFVPDRDRRTPGVDPTAVVAHTAILGSGIYLGAHAVVEAGASVGDGTSVLPGSFIGRGARVGGDCLIYPNATIREGTVIGDRVIVHSGAVIGSDGFGFVKDGSVFKKVPQIGNVVIGNDVEIGANVTIDRATTGSTVVGNGTKIDNLVQVGHNVKIGSNCIVVAQVGIGGSTEVGDGATLAGQAGLVGHIRIGEGATVAAQAGVVNSVPPGITVSGYPAREHMQANRIYASLQRLPELLKKIADLADRIERLEEKIRE